MPSGNRTERKFNMAKVNWKGGTLLAPVPAVMVSCGEKQSPNVCTVAWTGIINSNPPRTYISLRKSRLSHEIISRTGVFCINLTPSKLARITDFVGVKSGRDIDKFQKLNITAEDCAHIDTVSIAECPVSLECRVFDTIELGTHDMFLADIVGVTVDEALIDDTGKLHMEKAHLMAYSHGEYFTMGKRIGKMGYSVKKKSRDRDRK